MIVAMEEKNVHLEEKLKADGHRVVPLYGYGGAVDAVLYTDPLVCEKPLAVQNFGADGEGIFMLCTEGLTENEVRRALKMKSYSRIL